VLTAPLPPQLERALADATQGRSSARASAELTRRDRDPTASSGPVARSPDDVRAYAVARLPATYAAVRVALGELRSRMPSFHPDSLLDLGAGPGTAAWAVADTWPTVRRITAVEPAAEMRRLGTDLAQSAPSRAVADGEWLAETLPHGIPPARFDLVTLSYVLAEIDERDHATAVERAWNAAAHALVVVEPGTPSGYARMLAARDGLIALGATVVAPCPHDRACPLAGTGDWCHFAVRLARSRAHREAKDAHLGHEDEKFSYVVAARARAPQAVARILRHPQIRRGHVLLEICGRDGAHAQTISKRDGERYRRARKIAWGEDLGE
jgi:ribosomal protein RSM22 (predicted rRNA methylase)